MRELPIMTISRAIGRRITPARAGTTLPKHAAGFLDRDHPRTCGNYLTAPLRHLLLEGSPPHVRELLYIELDEYGERGITPARAGTTSIKLGVGTEREDHPRTCGNYRMAKVRTLVAEGSPPHVRELPSAWPNQHCRRRITPARAGTTEFFKSDHHDPRDHPRTCGNYALHGLADGRGQGSPPHVRELPENVHAGG